MKKKDPSKLGEYTKYDFQGQISNIVAKLEAIVKQHPNATINFELDWGGCYYEGDTPDIQIIIRSK